MNKRVRMTGKGRDKQFLALPHAIIKHENYARLSPMAVKLLVDFGSQYSGYNNGHLMATWSFLNEKRGWKSRDSFNKAKNELIDSGLLIVTRYGGKHKPNLYALTFQSIDEGKERLQIKPTNAPLGAWKKSHEYPDARPNCMFY